MLTLTDVIRKAKEHTLDSKIKRDKQEMAKAIPVLEMPYSIEDFM